MFSAQPSVVLEYNEETYFAADLVAMMWLPYLIVSVTIDRDRQMNKTALQSSVLEFGLLALLER